MPQIQLSRNAPQFQRLISGGTNAPSPWPDVLSSIGGLAIRARLAQNPIGRNRRRVVVVAARASSDRWSRFSLERRTHPSDPARPIWRTILPQRVISELM